MSNVIELSAARQQLETSSDEASTKEQLNSYDSSSNEDWDIRMQRIHRTLAAINDLMAQLRR